MQIAIGTLIGYPNNANKVGGIFDYLINDTFTSNRAAGAVQGTLAEPGPGSRTLIDTGNKVSLSGGQLVLAGQAANDPGVRHLPPFDRAPGRLMVAAFTITAFGVEIGIESGLSGSPADALRFSNTTLNARVNTGATVIAVGTVALSTAYRIAVVLRASGALLFIKGGAFSAWTLVWISSASTYGQAYTAAMVTSGTAAATCDYMRVPAEKWLPAPLASDGFSAWGTSDGLGHAEGIAGGLGAGGGGLSWTQQVGTWQAVGGAAKAASVTSSVAIATVDTGKADVVASVRFTRSAGNGGVVVRFVDSTNWVRGTHDGTSAYLIKNVGGTQTTVIGTPTTYVAGAEIRVICEGTKFRLYYNDAQVGSESTISDAILQSGTKQGLRATSTSDSFDDFAVYARGSGGEYAALDDF